VGADPIAVAKALAQYGPKVAQSTRRSQYLSDALRALTTDGGKITGGYGELGSKLLAQAILQRSSRKADEEAAGAYKGYRDERLARLLAGLPEAQAPEPPAPVLTPPEPAPQTPAPAPQVQAPMTPQPQSAPALDPGVDAIVRTVWGEPLRSGTTDAVRTSGGTGSSTSSSRSRARRTSR
jgi:hypothetical protein